MHLLVCFLFACFKIESSQHFEDKVSFKFGGRCALDCELNCITLSCDLINLEDCVILLAV